jgi:ribonuclease J
MNIITNKDVFSEDNQENILKKVEPRRRGRPRKTPLLDSVPQPPAPEKAPVADQIPLGSPVTSAQIAAEVGDNPLPTNGRVFYQGAGRRNQNNPPVQNGVAAQNIIDPRTLAARAARQQSAERVNQPTPIPTPTNPTQPNNRFTTAPRRRDRNRLPQDGAGAFMHPNGDVAPLAGGTRPKGEHTLKIIPLGGLEEIGKNMTVLEYGNDIVIIDMGFMFPDQEMFGVDYIIPDISYLEDKKDMIRGAVITHGHLDHIGAIPYLVQKLGFPTMYGTPITLGMVKGRLEEFNLLGRGKLQTIEPEKDTIQLGAFTIRPFHLIHSIPGAIGLEIETPNGRIAYCTDWKFDYNPASGIQIDFRTLAAIGTRGVDLLFSDSTNAEKPGHSISEKVVEQALSGAIEEAKGRVIVAMFATNLSRIQQTINAAAKHGRKVLLVGRSMVKNVEMAIDLKAVTVPPHTLISEREANRFNDEQVLVLSTGAQGEDRSALVRMASGEHRVIKIKKGDTVIISASPIPGNERSVSGLMDVLYKAGASVVYNKTLDVHTSGHANQEDLKLMLALMRPKYFVPLHGERSKLVIHGKLAEEVGVKAENVIIGDNGLILEMDTDGKVKPTDNHVPAGYVMVDGLGVGDVGNIVLRDRQAMAQEGFFEFISVYDTKKKQFLNSPDIISRGFIYMRENEQFVGEIRQQIKAMLAKASGKDVDISELKNEIRDNISKMLYEKTERQPMVIPVIIEV